MLARLAHSSFKQLKVLHMDIISKVNIQKCIQINHFFYLIQISLNLIHSSMSVLFNFPVTNIDDPCHDIPVLNVSSLWTFVIEASARRRAS